MKQLRRVALIALSLVLMLLSSVSVKAEQKQIDVSQGMGSAQSNYVKAFGCQISVPEDWTPVVNEQPGEDESNYVAIASGNGEGFKLEAYLNMLDKKSTKGIKNMGDVTDDQKLALQKAMEKTIKEGIPADFDAPAKLAWEEFNGNTYMSMEYNVHVYGRSIYEKDYYTIVNGVGIMYSGYADLKNESQENAKKYVETIVGNTLYGTEDEVAKLTKKVEKPAEKKVELSTKQKMQEALGKVDLPTWIFLALAAVVLIIGIKFKKPKEWNEDFLGLSNSKSLLGMCAVLIVLHHLSQGLAENAGELAWLENIGVCFVGIFFFFSGFGLLKSLKTKDNYLKGFFRKRIPAVWIPFFICILVFFFTNVALGEKYSAVQVVKILTGWFLINTHMWYIVEIILFYIMFYVIFRFIKNRNIGVAVMAVLVAAFTVISLMLGHGENWFQGEWWFNTSLLFVFGMFIANGEEKIVALAKRFYIPMLVVSTGATVGFYMATKYMLDTYSYWSEVEGEGVAALDKFRCLSCQLPMVLFFVITILLITMKIKFKNPILKFLGTISLEIYLIHNLFLGLFQNYKVIVVSSPFMYTLFVLAATILLATVLHYVDHFLVGLTKKKK